MRSHVYLLSTILLGVAGSVMAQTVSVTATKPAPNQAENKQEALSGIYLFPNQKQGTFTLLFKKPVQEPARLELSDAATGQILYAGIVLPDKNQQEKRYNVGKLENGTYLIEVKTDDTTYWTKMNVKNPPQQAK